MKKYLLTMMFLLTFTFLFSQIQWNTSPSNYEIVPYNKTITLNFNLIERDVLFYIVYLGENKNNLKDIYKGKENYVHIQLTPNKNYFWKVIAYTKDKIYSTETLKFFLELKSPVITNCSPANLYNVFPENIEFKWNVDFNANYIQNFILYEKNKKILEKRVENNSLKITYLKPGLQYKWKIIITDEFGKKYYYGPYIFYTKPYEFYISNEYSIFKVKTYGEFLEKKEIFNSKDRIKNYIPFHQFIIINIKSKIEIIHNLGNKTSEILLNNEISDFYIEEYNNQVLLYITTDNQLCVYDITNPYYPYILKKLKGDYISVSTNSKYIFLLSKNTITVMNHNFKKLNISRNFNNVKIIYNDNAGLIILTNDSIKKISYKNNKFKTEKEFSLKLINNYFISKNIISFSTKNKELYIFDHNLNLINYLYLNDGIKSYSIYGNGVYYFNNKNELKIAYLKGSE
ncbi:hypothetical protein Marpi_1328 [Marinitoga piezophila KA3]|uniref:Fibronectin type-III domain-containing protein n=1 Tax=Marinitoga piezophila (strain DSM 14283 / JCM 11233 / KA3) TaxID=443254 RepID=H2J3B5_MARPK|nr:MULTISPECIES: hypothetical protein [Marinitoga]AEX85731.1 hypothetical protein Marpi_1328 [Marinitoga piezophila KA3]APT76182.1 hypothetical protein LN42_07125 [Marinitoga sp. 1137]